MNLTNNQSTLTLNQIKKAAHQLSNDSSLLCATTSALLECYKSRNDDDIEAMIQLKRYLPKREQAMVGSIVAMLRKLPEDLRNEILSQFKETK